MSSLLQSKFIYGLTGVLVVQAVLFYSASHGEMTPLAVPLSGFPFQAGAWKQQQELPMDKETQEVLKADDTLNRVYAGPQGGADLFIAYFATQRQGQSPHSPRNCLPGSGWQPSETGRINVPIGVPVEGNAGDSISINRYVVSKGEARDIVLYWYQTQGRVIADEFMAKFFLISDSIRNHRSDTALVRVVVPITAGRAEAAEKMGTDFVQVFYPVVKAYLPR
jgi:EpsI family protein